jgi:hypothetical protein
MSLRSIDYYLAAEKFKTRRIGKKVLIPHSELVRIANSDHREPVNSHERVSRNSSSETNTEDR